MADALYTINGVLQADDDPDAVEFEMDMAWAGATVFRNGAWTYLPGATRAPIRALTVDDVIEVQQVQLGPDSQDRVNIGLMAIAQDKDRGYLPARLPERNLQAELQLDGGRREVDLGVRGFVSNLKQAERVLVRKLREARPSILVTLLLMPGPRLENLGLHAGDIVTYTDARYGLQAERCLVQSATINKDMSVTVALRGQPALGTSRVVAAAATGVSPGSTERHRGAAPPRLTSFTVTELEGGTRSFNFDLPAWSSIAGVRIRQAGSNAPWDSMTALHGGLLGASPYETQLPKLLGDYWFEARVVSQSGVESGGSRVMATLGAVSFGGEIDAETLKAEVDKAIEANPAFTDLTGEIEKAEKAATGAETAQTAAEAAQTAAETASTTATAAVTAAEAEFEKAVAEALKAGKSAESADGSATAAAGSATTASESADASADSATASASSASASAASATTAAGSADAAAGHAMAAMASSTLAGQHAESAATWGARAETAATGAEGSAAKAAASALAAAQSESNADGSAKAAAVSALTAEAAVGNAEAARDAASGHSDAAAASAAAAAGVVSTATAEKNAANTAAMAASASAQVARASATTAAGSAMAASTHAQTATAKSTEAGTFATAASAQATIAATESAKAGTFATQSSDSATLADGSAEASATSAQAAAAQSMSAAGSATAAATSALTASTKAGEAETSASAANVSRLAAVTAQSAAEVARDDAVSAKTSIDGSASSVATSATEAKAAVVDAQTAATAAEAAETAAETAEAAAAAEKAAAEVAKAAAEAAKTAAEQHGMDSEASKVAAKASETAADKFKAAAETAKDAAEVAKDAAEEAQRLADLAKVAASASQKLAADAQVAADGSATAAASSATEAAASATGAADAVAGVDVAVEAALNADLSTRFSSAVVLRAETGDGASSGKLELTSLTDLDGSRSTAKIRADNIEFVAGDASLKILNGKLALNAKANGGVVVGSDGISIDGGIVRSWTLLVDREATPESIASNTFSDFITGDIANYNVIYVFGYTGTASAPTGVFGGIPTSVIQEVIIQSTTPTSKIDMGAAGNVWIRQGPHANVLGLRRPGSAALHITSIWGVRA